MKPEISLFDENDTADLQLHELLTVNEVASLLKVPKSWVYDHVRKRGIEMLPHIKLGKYLRFVESDVRTFLDALSRRKRG
jgi:excisionase family DNA binding protein